MLLVVPQCALLAHQLLARLADISDDFAVNLTLWLIASGMHRMLILQLLLLLIREVAIIVVIWLAPCGATAVAADHIRR